MEITQIPVSDGIEKVDAEIFIQKELAQLSQDVAGGTRAMVAAGERYIPKGKEESHADYETRLKRGMLYNGFERTLDFLTGHVFQQPIGLNAKSDKMETPASITNWADDVDLQGNNLTRWSKSVFTRGLIDGVSFVIVDYPKIETRTNNGTLEYYNKQSGTWQVKTQAVDKELKAQPYLIHVPLDKVIAVWSENINGVETITHFRYKEVDYVRDSNNDYSRIKRETIRVYEYGGKYEVWERLNSSGDYKKLEGLSGTNSIQELPLAIFIPSERKNMFTAMPPLESLAQICLRYWKSVISYYNIKEFNDHPMWFGRQLQSNQAMIPYNATEVPEETKLELTPNKMYHASSPTADIKSITIDPNCMRVSKEDLDELKQSMTIYGMHLLENKKSAEMTATESINDSTENNSTLRAWAVSFQDFLNHVLYFVGKYEGNADDIECNIFKDFTMPMNPDVLRSYFTSMVISHRTILTIAKNIGLLPPDLDIEQEITEVKNSSRMITGTKMPSLSATLSESTQSRPNAGV